jgi:hypothetical protein
LVEAAEMVEAVVAERLVGLDLRAPRVAERRARLLLPSPRHPDLLFDAPSTQIGCRRRFPLPGTTITGPRASFLKLGSMPPSAPKTKLGLNTVHSSPEACSAYCASHLARE